MTYRENVERAATALRRGEAENWELARLTFESTRGLDEESRIDRVTMATWCTDVVATAGRPFSQGTGTRFKALWRKYGGVSLKERPSWADAWLENAGLTRETSRAAAASSATRNAPPETKRAIFAELAADPVVVEHAAELGTPTSQAVSRLTHQAGAIRKQRREQAIEADPIARRLERQRAALDLEASCNRFAQDCVRFAREITDLLPETGAASEKDLDWIRRAIERGRAALEQLDTYVSTGRTDLDTFLANVLGGHHE